MPDLAGCDLVRVKTGETGPAGTRYAIRDGVGWKTAADPGTLEGALESCNPSTAAAAAWLVTAFSREVGGYDVMTEPKPGLVVRWLNAAGWDFAPPTLRSDGETQRLTFLALGPDGEFVNQVEVIWSAETAPTVSVTRAPG